MRSRTLTTAGLGAAAAAAMTPVALPAVAAATTRHHPAKTRRRVVTRTYKGNVERTFYSNVQVTITVQGKKIKNLSVNANPQDQQSYAREAYALPILRKEVLRAQSYRVHTISGVTITSQGFIVSLYSAMKHGHLV
ncbi:MAG TPA: FMN-binding protein [Solirubrobacteraceae bacterium]|nr:FMN-binding protein [Solirubrobacteraceae bacterium]